MDRDTSLKNTAEHPIPFYIIPSHVVSCHVISFHAVSCYIVPSHVISYHPVSLDLISFNIVFSRLVSSRLSSTHLVSPSLLSLLLQCPLFYSPIQLSIFVYIPPSVLRTELPCIFYSAMFLSVMFCLRCCALTVHSVKVVRVVRVFRSSEGLLRLNSRLLYARVDTLVAIFQALKCDPLGRQPWGLIEYPDTEIETGRLDANCGTEVPAMYSISQRQSPL